MAGLVLLAAVLVGGTGLVASTAQTSEGCEKPTGPIAESSRFTPYGARLSHLPERPVTSTGGPPHSGDRQPESLDGLALRWVIGDGDRAFYRYFFSRPMTGESLPEFHGGGGIQLDRDLVAPGQDFTDELLKTLGDRAVEVQIGDHRGALVWADPESNGVRPHHLYWSDGTYNYTLAAVRGPIRMVELGRELECGSE